MTTSVAALAFHALAPVAIVSATLLGGLFDRGRKEAPPNGRGRTVRRGGRGADRG